MTLLTAHRILIASAVLFFVFYAFWEFFGADGTGGGGGGLRGGVSLLAAGGLAVYFRTIGKNVKGDEGGPK